MSTLRSGNGTHLFIRMCGLLPAMQTVCRCKQFSSFANAGVPEMNWWTHVLIIWLLVDVAFVVLIWRPNHGAPPDDIDL